jgi:NSS family neurotransmitter:Na+ symporter
VSDAEPSARTTDAWSSRFAFFYACAAASIGLGSLWRFPYVAGQNGGGAFVILFLVFILALCVPLMMAEMMIGRRGGGSAILSVSNLIRGEKAWGAWGVIGWLSILIPALGLSYYSVVAGWGLDYAREAVVHGFKGISGAQSEARFDLLSKDWMRQGAMQGALIAAVTLVVILGVQRGIEWVSKIKMVGLIVIMIGLVAYGAMNLDFGRAVDFLFKPNFAALTPDAVLQALGQAMFSTSVGVGVIMTYSAYVPNRMSLGGAALAINGSVAAVASMAGLAIFPAVFTYGLKPGGGPSLIFVTLPAAFGQMPGGFWIAILFFVMIVLAAFTVMVGMLEPVVAWVRERTGLGRTASAILSAAVIFAVGLPSLLSTSILADWHPLAGVKGFSSMTFFNLLDYFIGNIAIPINALLIALFVGWFVKRATVDEELSIKGVVELAWRLSVMLLAPVLIVGLMLSLIFPDLSAKLLAQIHG